MPKQPDWQDVGSADVLRRRAVQPITVGRTRYALIYRNGEFGALAATCNHVGGPLGEGQLEGDYVVCPWHQWRFHFKTGRGEPGFEEDAVPSYPVKVEHGRVLIDVANATVRQKKPHEPHPLARTPERQPGSVRLVGISTTAMDPNYPRYSTSDALLEIALEHGKSVGVSTQLLRLTDLKVEPCRGYYSKSAQACTWPCSITQMDPTDQMDRIYEAFVHWADVILIATPIRWGNASSLYYKMVERMNCIQNQETIASKRLMKNKVAAFIITGGQDNVQAVAGQLLGFFAELGCQFPQFPYIAHSRGWSAEDMENNIRYVMNSQRLKEGTRALVDRAVKMAEVMVSHASPEQPYARGGRKAHELDTKAQL